MNPATPDTDPLHNEAAADGAAPDDGARDTLASVLRDAGAYALPIDDETELHRARCEAWVRHVLTGADAPVAPLVGSTVDPDEPAWAQLKLFHRDRRQAEKRFVDGRLDEFKGIIWDIVHGLRTITDSGSDAHTRIDQALARLEDAVASNSLETVRAALGPAVGSIRDAMARQRDQFSAEMQRMTARLDNMRDDLIHAREQMQVDALTKVYNRGAFDDAIARYVDLAALSRQPMTLMMLDLDHFKATNDTHGHQAGDAVLRAVGETLIKSFLRKNDFVARYGGEEFAVILGDTPDAMAPRLADKALFALRRLDVPFEDEYLPVTASVGYASLIPGETAADIIARADEALYRAKENGRDRAEAALDHPNPDEPLA